MEFLKTTQNYARLDNSFCYQVLVKVCKFLIILIFINWSIFVCIMYFCHTYRKKTNAKILLQTRNALVADKKEKNYFLVKLLLDPGSQQTSVSQKVEKGMQLKPWISGFLGHWLGKMKPKEYKIKFCQ